MLRRACAEGAKRLNLLSSDSSSQVCTVLWTAGAASTLLLTAALEQDILQARSGQICYIATTARCTSAAQPLLILFHCLLIALLNSSACTGGPAHSGQAADYLLREGPVPRGPQSHGPHAGLHRQAPAFPWAAEIAGELG